MKSARRLPRMFEYLGLRRNYVLLLGMVVLVGMGERIGSRFLPKYLEVLGAGVLIIGVYGALNNLLGALWSYVGGQVTDRMGMRRALQLFNGISILGYLVVIAFPLWPAVLAAMVLFTAWSALSLPAVLSLVSHSLPRGRRAMGVSMHSILRRIPMSAGPVLGGYLIARFGMRTGIRLAFALAAALALLSLLLPLSMGGEAGGRYEALRARELWRRFSPALRRLLVSDILIRFCEQIPDAFVVLWVMDTVGRSAPDFGWLTALEMVTAMLLYIPVAHFSDRAERKPFVLATFGFFTLFPLALFFSRSIGLLALAFVVRGLKEFGEPTRKALIAELSVEGAKGRTVGLYYLLRDLVVTMAAFLGGVLWKIHPAWNLWTAFGFGTLGTIYFALFGKAGASGKEVPVKPGQ